MCVWVGGYLLACLPPWLLFCMHVYTSSNKDENEGKTRRLSIARDCSLEIYVNIILAAKEKKQTSTKMN